jgi:hypothetical protein
MNQNTFCTLILLCVAFETFTNGMPLQQEQEEWENDNAFEEIITSSGVLSSLYSDFVQKHQSLYPECTSQNNVLEGNNEWINKTRKSMYMRFSLDHLQHSGFVTKPLTGTLKLFQKEYLLPGTNSTLNLQNSITVDNREILTNSLDTISGSRLNATLPRINDQNFPQETEILEVTISLVQSYSNKTVKMVPLDSKILTRQTVKGGKWINFNILETVEEWINNTNTNFGIIIDVQHGGEFVQPDSIFQAMNCSDSARHPYPSLLGSLGRDVLENITVDEQNSALYFERLNIKAYPILDVTIVEIPRTMEISKEESPPISLFFVVNFESLNDFNKTSMTISDTINEGALSLARVYPMAKSIETAYDIMLPTLDKFDEVSFNITNDDQETNQVIRMQQQENPSNQFNPSALINTQVQLREEEFNNWFG